MNRSKPLIIAIDGFSSSGKSTLAKDLARETGYVYIDSGAMYRAVTLFCMEEMLILEGRIDEQALAGRMGDIHIEFRINPVTGHADTWLNNRNVEKEIRQLAVSNLVSPVSKIGFVREALVSLQRSMGQKGGVVMDGRDIGTVVFPDADLKIFVTSDPAIRAKRRFDELISKGEEVTLKEVQENLTTRDHIDSSRANSPLRQAEDAIMLNNSFLTREEQLEKTLQLVSLVSQQEIGE